MSEIDWETWLVEDAGDAVIEKKARAGRESLSDAERLTYCMWVADYGMRNAGDLETAAELYPSFQIEGADLASKLGLQTTARVFRLTYSEIEAVYFEKFEVMCAEIAGALKATDGTY